MPDPSSSGIDLWRKVLHNAHKRRLEATRLIKPIEELAGKHPASPESIAEVVVNLRVGDAHDKDPLVIRYVDTLLKLKCVTASALLLALLRNSRYTRPSPVPVIASVPLPTFEEKVFTLLRDMLANTDFPAATWKAHGIIFALARWLHVVSQFEMAQQLELGALHTVDIPTSRMYEALGMLAYSVYGHRHFRDIEKQPWWTARKSLIVRELDSFDSHVLQWIHSQLAGHLQALTRARPFLETDQKGRPIFSRDQTLTMHSDLPDLKSRAGLFVWLTACLHARPLTDDATMRNYLMVRYHDDAQAAAVDVVLASFDVLMNSTLKRGTPRLQKIVRSFICNKLPLLLLSLSTFMASGAIETCISMTLISINLDPLTPLGSGAAEVGDMVKKTRVEFLQACMLHALVTEATVTTVLHNQTVSQPKVPRYNKAALLTQSANNTAKLEQLIQELDSMHGNAGAISGCIVDMVNNLCSIKDTMTLKTVCSFLLRKVSAWDVILQYTQATAIIPPLCTLLNEWVHDQDQTEFQPPYEEFAVILLFALAFIHRYDLRRADLGLTDDQSFMVKLLRERSHSIPLSELTDEQNKQLSNWIGGLYATDEHGETVGIADEVYSQCPPQAFYLLVPTLFEQTVLACKSKALSVNTVKGGVEFLLEPFLLPSLVGGLGWMIEHFWQNPKDADIQLQILDKLLKPSSTSQDVQAMHRAILAIVAEPLERSLQAIIRKRPEKKKEANAVIELLKPHLAQQCTNRSTKSQLEEWASLDEGGLSGHVRNSVRELALWASDGGSSAPPKYSPCVIIEAEHNLGTEQTLNILVEELKEQTTAGNGPVIIDVCVAIICAPDPETYTPLVETLLQTQPDKVRLRDCLRLFIADQATMLDLPFKKAEALIRLSRKVEAQLGVSQMAMVSLSLPAQETAEQVMQDLGLSATDASLDAAAAIVQAGNVGFDNSAFAVAADPALDLTNATSQDLDNMVSNANLMDMDQSQDIFGDFNMDLSGQPSGMGDLDPNSDANNGQQNPDDDIFAGLDMRNLGEDFSFT